MHLELAYSVNLLTQDYTPVRTNNQSLQELGHTVRESHPQDLVVSQTLVAQ